MQEAIQSPHSIISVAISERKVRFYIRGRKTFECPSPIVEGREIYSVRKSMTFSYVRFCIVYNSMSSGKWVNKCKQYNYCCKRRISVKNVQLIIIIQVLKISVLNESPLSNINSIWKMCSNVDVIKYSIKIDRTAEHLTT